MEFIIGKYYKTRDGRKAIFLEYKGGLSENNYAIFKVEGQDSKLVLWSDGRLAFSNLESEDDIVAEWSEPQPLKLEIGKWYKAENGYIGQCERASEGEKECLVVFGDIELNFDIHGNRCFNDRLDFRIISEVPNPNQPSEVCEREIGPQESEATPFDFNLLTTEQFQQHLTETIKNKKAQRERNLFSAIARAHQSHEVVPSWMLEEILKLRSNKFTVL